MRKSVSDSRKKQSKQSKQTKKSKKSKKPKKQKRSSPFKKLLIITSLLGYLANSNLVPYYHGYQPLEYAIKTGNIKKINSLLENNINKDYIMDNLKIAYEYDNNILKLLLDNKVDPKVILKDVLTDRDFYVLKMLFNYGVSPNDILFYSVESKDTELLNILLQSGANPNLHEDMFDYTILDIAALSQNQENINLLKKYGAKHSNKYLRKIEYEKIREEERIKKGEITKKERDKMKKSIKEEYDLFFKEDPGFLERFFGLKQKRTLEDYYKKILDLKPRDLEEKNVKFRINNLMIRYGKLRRDFKNNPERLKLINKALLYFLKKEDKIAYYKHLLDIDYIEYDKHLLDIDYINYIYPKLLDKKYKENARLYHPDTGGSEELFNDLRKAYEFFKKDFRK